MAGAGVSKNDATVADLRIDRDDFEMLLTRAAQRLRGRARMSFRTCRRTRVDDLQLDWDGEGEGASTVTRVERTDARLSAPWVRMRLTLSTLPLHAFPCAIEEVRDVMAVGTISFSLDDGTALSFEQQAFEDGSRRVFRVYVRARTLELAEAMCHVVVIDDRRVASPPPDEDQLRAMLRAPPPHRLGTYSR